ncbi:MAG: class I SAM-dependent methyltransferase [Deltaproteobacteria bacterium]|nr:class I SAM-dependent methyltransferase [Deltaproteobacteria bacterium]
MKPRQLIENIKEMAGRARFETLNPLIGPIRAHAETLAEWSVVFNLTGPGTDEQAAESLYFDSLIVAGHLAKALAGCVRIDDVGSGAGFPALFLPPLFAAEVSFVLHEARRKKASFLRFAARSMGLANVVVSNRRVEAGSFASDAVLSRATLPPKDWLALAATLIRPGGRAVLLKTGHGGAGGIVTPKNLVHESTFEYTLPLSGRERAAVVYVSRATR